MPRKGREFELLIGKLENIVLPKGAKISSPGFIKDRITGQQREVDILIEHNVGTSNIKIVIECRDRTSTQDTQWIEQIHTKLNDINVHKAIVVSSSRFTQPAIEKAKFCNIETRTYEEITTDFIKSWWSIEQIRVISRQFTIISAIIDIDNPSMNERLNEEVFKGKTPEMEFINSTVDDQIFSLNDVFIWCAKEIDDWDSLLPDGPPTKKNFVTHFNNPGDRFEIRLHDIKTGITRITFDVELRIISKLIPVSRVSQYGDNEKVISQVVEFEGLPIAGYPALQFIRNSDGSIAACLQEKNNCG
jgi:hypothetical protein